MLLALYVRIQHIDVGLAIPEMGPFTLHSVLPLIHLAIPILSYEAAALNGLSGYYT